MRNAVPRLIQELEEACRQSLYNGNSTGTEYPKQASSGSTRADRSEVSTKKRRRRLKQEGHRKWEVILGEAADNLVSMNEQEHGQVSRLASILLLGFLLPQSTGNEFFLLQHFSTRKQHPRRQAAGSQTSEHIISNEGLSDHIIQMSLEERLASVPQRYCPENFGELDSIVDANLDAAFSSFLKQALQPFLSGRPAHTQQVDLLHLIAMAIHPQPSEQPIRATVGHLEGKESEAWSSTTRLMSSLLPHNFQLNYRHRLHLVQLVANCLVLPGFDSDRAGADAPLMEGALPHLRASLYAFGMAAQNPHDSHWSQCGLVSTAIQTGSTVVIREEWGRLLNRLMDDRTDYHCCHSSKDDDRSCFSLMTDQATFCLHRARGELLENFLMRFSEARHYADSEFLQQALGSLTDAIEFKVDCWTQVNAEDNDDSDKEKRPDGDEEYKQNEDKQEISGTDMKDAEGIDGIARTHKTSEPPCVLASLLLAAKPLLYFLLPIAKHADGGSEESEDSQRRDMLVSCAIQLAHHWNSDIAKEASKLLVLSFCYGPQEMITDYAGAVFESAKLAITRQIESDVEISSLPVEGIVASFSKQSSKIGEAFLSLLLSRSDERKGESLLFCRLVAAVASSCPAAAQKQKVAIIDRLHSNSIPSGARVHLVAALLACRRAHFFNKPEDEVTKCVEKCISSGISGWELYLLGRQALVSGNFNAGFAIYDELSMLSTSEQSFLWMSALKSIAKAESMIISNGAIGIPNATIHLRSAAATFLSMPSFTESRRTSFASHIRLLNLRLDFLELVGIIRQLACEMRLTNVGPQKFTRPSLNLRNGVKFLNVLASKYLTLYRQYGLFTCQQSRTTLRTLHAICRFVSSAARSTFIDELPETSVGDFQKSAIQALTLPKGDAFHPVITLMNRLDSSVLKDMNSFVDAKIRAAALLQVIDGVLKVPSPFPRSFLSTKPIPSAKLLIAINPDLLDDHGDGDDEIEDEIDVPSGSAVTIFASGYIPDSLLKRATLPFYVILLWHTVSFTPSSEEVDTPQDDKQEEEITSSSGTRSLESSFNLTPIRDSGPTATSLSSSGTFFLKAECDTLVKHGLYTIETRLGCRDIRGGEWELPFEKGTHSIPIRVSKSV